MDDKLEAIGLKLDKLLAILEDKPTYTGSRKLDYILEEAYANNEPVDSVIKRHNKSTKGKVGKDLDRLDEVLRENAEKAVAKTPVFSGLPPKYTEEWDGVHDSEGC